MCSFCNQNTISGAQKAPDAEDVKKTCSEAFGRIKNKSDSEIAFFGGSFTAVPASYRKELLECVQEFIGEDGFKGIRISTRPDCIDNDILSELEKYHVTSIELGCQSMDDRVLFLNDRGHDADAVRNAVSLIKSYGCFELGLQMMTGLYGSSPDDDIYTAREIAKLSPDTVRIYPVVVLKGTRLAELYKKEIYKIFKLDEMILLCSEIMDIFRKNKIRIIKCGLHASEIVENDMVAGYYHPAFRELCESRIFRKNLDRYFNGIKSTDLYNVAVSEKFISKATGQKRSNIDYFNAKGINIKIISDKYLSDGEFIIYNSQKEVVNVFKVT